MDSLHGGQDRGAGMERGIRTYKWRWQKKKKKRMRDRKIKREQREMDGERPNIR